MRKVTCLISLVMCFFPLENDIAEYICRLHVYNSFRHTFWICVITINSHVWSSLPIVRAIWLGIYTTPQSLIELAEIAFYRDRDLTCMVGQMAVHGSHVSGILCVDIDPFFLRETQLLVSLMSKRCTPYTHKLYLCAVYVWTIGISSIMIALYLVFWVSCFFTRLWRNRHGFSF